MPQIYNDEFKEKIVRLQLQQRRTYKSLADELFSVSKASIFEQRMQKHSLYSK